MSSNPDTTKRTRGRLVRVLAVLRPWHIVVLTVVLRLAMFLLVGSWDERVAGEVLLKSDALLYHNLGAHLADNGDFERESIRTPGYICYVGAIYAIAGPHPWAVIASQILMDALIAWLCFQFASRLIGREGGIVASLLYACDPAANLNANTLMSDTLFTLLLLLAALAALRALTDPDIRSALPFHLLAAVLLGASALTRPIAVYFVPLYAVIILWSARRRPFYAAATVAAIVALFVSTISPWVLRNHQQFGEYGLSSSGTLNLFHLYAIPTESLRSGVSAQVAMKNIIERAGVSDDYLATPRGNQYRQHQKLGAIAADYLASYPEWFAWATVVGLGQMFVNSGSGTYATLIGIETGPTDLKDAVAEFGFLGGFKRMVGEKSAIERASMVINSSIHAVQYLLLLYGVWVLRRDLLRAPFLPLVVFICLYAGIIGAAGLMRFKLPIVPFYLVVAGVGGVAFALRGALPAGARVKVRQSDIVISVD